MSTGMPAGIWLGKFAAIVTDYFGHECYHVGSSLTSKAWRDVDVRLILPDAEFEARFGEIHSAEANPKLGAVTLAFSALAAHMTGLPVDFQIQPVSHANGFYGDSPRSALVEYRPQPSPQIHVCPPVPPTWMHEYQRVRAALDQRNKAYGRASATIGDLRARVAALRSDRSALADELAKVSGGWGARLASRHRLRDERDAAYVELARARNPQPTPQPLPFGDGEDDAEVWVPPASDCMEHRPDRPCPHCGDLYYHHRTRRCARCGRRP